MLLTASFTWTAPVLPPTTRIIGLSVVKLQRSSPAALLPSKSSCLIGEPVRTAFPSRKILESFWEIAAYFSCFSHSNLVGKSWCHIGFVDNHWNMTASSGKNNRYRHEASLRKYDIRFDFFISLLA